MLLRKRDDAGLMVRDFIPCFSFSSSSSSSYMSSVTRAKWDDYFDHRGLVRADQTEQGSRCFVVSGPERRASPRLSLLGMSCRLSVAERSMPCTALLRYPSTTSSWLCNPYKRQTLHWPRHISATRQEH